jgi:PAS domain S-box-containing protein
MTSFDKFQNPSADASSIEQSKLEKLLELQSSILGATVTSSNYEDLLEQVCLFAEKLTHDSVASIMLYDKAKNQLFVHAAPSMPTEVRNELDGLTVGDGSCGNAIYHNEDMFVCNTLTDRRWDNVQSLVTKFKVHACWSSPIHNTSNEPIGSFALSSFEERTPDNFQRRLLNICSSITGIIIQRELTLKESRSDRKKLIDSRQQYRSLVDNSADAIFLHDDAGNILDANQMACDSLDYTHSELLSMTIDDIEVSRKKFDDFPAFANSLSFDKTYNIDGTLQRKDGSEYPVEARVRRYISDKKPFIVALVRDVAERKKAEKETLRARKLDSIGLLAGGIAHDFNNLLGIIQGYIDLASRSMTSSPEKTKTYFKKATNATIQAADLTQQLLTFSKGGELIKKTTNVMEVIHQATDFSLHGSNIKVEYICQDNLWPADIDSGQISQVIQNLAINARQAMPQGGKLEITCDNCVISELDNSSNIPAGKYLKISVKDNGTGIAEDILDSIFDPYFTTKDKGGGLGLALCYSIIDKHNGSITVDSTSDNGTTFTLLLPANDKQKISVATASTPAETQTKNARIMIMDDDEILREISKEMLLNLGYEVAQSPDGGNALSQYKAAMDTKNNIDLVIMGLTIPSGIGGKEAIKLIQKIDPNVKALISSGYSNDPVMANYNDYGFMGAVRKPYSQDELGAAISTILNQ